MSSSIVPPTTDFVVENLVAESDRVVVMVRSARETAMCPCCNRPSRRPHSSYTRKLRDIPWGGTPAVRPQAVVVEATVHRWCCDTPDCPRKIFCERLPEIAPAHARRTSAFTQMVAQIGWEAGGEGTSRIGRAIGLPTSGDTVLRMLRAAPEIPPPPARVIGIDDWALRKGQRYATLVVDQERQRVLDLLPDREEATVVAWLKAHPEVEVITRDRDGVYARAAARGAPQARQVADRWHLLHNLAEAVQAVVTRRHPQPVVEGTVPDASEPHDDAAPTCPPSPGEQHRQARFEAVRRLRGEGRSLREIARELNLARHTVRKYAQAEQCPPYKTRPPRSRVLAPWEERLSQLWEQGTRTGRALCDALQAEGYRGSLSTVRRWVTHRRRATKGDASPASSRERRIPSRTLACAFLLPWTGWPRSWTRALTLLLSDPILATLWTLVHLFTTMTATRKGASLESWLRAAEASGIPELIRLAHSLRRDVPAVQAALTEPWSQGRVEGFINKLKCKKRQMFGRAKFDLLRKHMLHVA